MKKILSMVFVAAFAAVTLAPSVSEATWGHYGWWNYQSYDKVVVDGEYWQKVKSGTDVCAVVREHYDVCRYVKYSDHEKTHYVETEETHPQQDRLIVKNVNDEVIDDFLVPAGTDHRTAVATRRGVDISEVEWLSGDTQPNESLGYGYEAILLIRH